MMDVCGESLGKSKKKELPKLAHACGGGGAAPLIPVVMHRGDT